MPLKIICVEEHLNDAHLDGATRSAMLRRMPYIAAMGRFSDDPDVAQSGLPATMGTGRMMEIVNAPLEQRLADLDAHGIDVQVVSYTQWAQFAPIETAADLTRSANDRLAEAVSRRPDRFGGFSTLPWQDLEAAVRELERSATELGLTGTMLLGTPAEDAFLDDPRFEPILAKLEDLRVPLYLHPAAPMLGVQKAYFAGLPDVSSARLSTFGWGMHHEAGVHVLRLILSGVLDRHPDLRIISGHWGEMVPFYLARLDDILPPGATGLSRTISRTYRDQVYVTPSGMLGAAHFRFVYETVGAERIMMSIDYPYLTLTGARAWVEALPISEAERAAIAYGNAQHLLRLGH